MSLCVSFACVCYGVCVVCVAVGCLHVVGGGGVLFVFACGCLCCMSVFCVIVCIYMILV